MLWPCRAINYIYITAGAARRKKSREKKEGYFKLFHFLLSVSRLSIKERGKSLSSPRGDCRSYSTVFLRLRSTPRQTPHHVEKQIFGLAEPPQSFTVPTVRVCLKRKYRILLPDFSSLCSACPQCVFFIFFHAGVLISGPFTGII